MRYTRVSLLVSGLGLSLIQALAPGWGKAEPVVACDTAAYVVDPDPKGLNVRSGPGKGFGVTAVLPTRQAEPMVKVNVEISGYSAGWLRISQARDYEGRPLLKKPGWVHASMLATSTRTGPQQKVSLLQRPDARAAVAARIPELSQVGLISCRGPWLEVRQGKAPVSGHGVNSGWLRREDQCPLSETTCP